MGYYADLINEKRNSAESHLKGLIGKKFKRDTDLERAVNGSIYTEISDWSHPRMVVFDKYTDEKYILTTEDNNQYGKDQEFWISKVQKVNSKEEKDNASVQDRFRYKGCMITILKKGENQYTFSIEQNGREEGTNTAYPTQDKAESEAKREVEANWNEKEETKENENFHYLGKTFSVTSGNYKDVRRQIEQTYKDAVAKLERKISSATGSEKAKLEADLREIKSGYKETLEEFDWGFGNEKEEEKQNLRSFSDIESAFRFIESNGYTIEQRDYHKKFPMRWEWLPVQKDGKKEQIEFFKKYDDNGNAGKVEIIMNSNEERDNGNSVWFEEDLVKMVPMFQKVDKESREEIKKRLLRTYSSMPPSTADRILDKAGIKNSDEEGYYAKLAEEKASRKN